MKAGFYIKLAWTGIRKNKRMYTPFILTCVGMVMMQYIIIFLANWPHLSDLNGGGTLRSILSFGSWVIAIFAAIFLFYTNSFLIRRRKKEFGLYNILGMGKWNIARILFWETAISAALSLAAGLSAGIILSKLAELGLVNMMQGNVIYDLSVSPPAILLTVIFFLVIFALIFINTLRQIHAVNAITLLHSENAGEKPPRANWVGGVLGVVLLAAAYIIAVSIQSPVEALAGFFIAVIMVIVGTYLLFIAGSGMLCRILQNKKSYYYKSSHFVSVSSMAYRMKRNGAGLASICILSTMVLVMISSSASLYLGTEDSLQTRYPRQFSVRADFETLDNITTDAIAQLRGLTQQSATQSNILEYQDIAFSAILENGAIYVDERVNSDTGLRGSSVLCQIYFMPLADYNRSMGENRTLTDEQVIIHARRINGALDKITLGPSVFEVAETLETLEFGADSGIDLTPTLYIIVPNLQQANAALQAALDETAGADAFIYVAYSWHYAFDTDLSDEAQIALSDQIRNELRRHNADDADGLYHYFSCQSRAANRGDFYASNSGLFFIGIILSIVFIFAAALIIYYKQISEGYEEQSRFEIMQKVGMTKREIRKSINAQMLTVFFLPLGFAAMHLCFAFPIVQKLLLLFNLFNVRLLLAITAICILVFALFYMLVYRITSNTYYSIVSGAKED